MKNKNHSITKIYKVEESTTEIDFTLRDKVLGKDWDEHENRFDEIVKGGGGQYGQSSPIEIDKVIKTLQGFKDSGCNHVEIMYHEDHIGYYFYGLDIHRSTDQEVAEEKERRDKIENRRTSLRIKSLEAELSKLKKQ